MAGEVTKLCDSAGPENKKGKYENFRSNWKRILYLICFGLSVSGFDFSTDVFTGLELLNIINSVDVESESHLVWGTLT